MLVLVVRGQADGAESEVELAGRTSRGAEIVLTLRDGKLQRLHTEPAAWCPQHRRWIAWLWSPTTHVPDARFEQEGDRFLVEERKVFTEHEPPSDVVSVLRGELYDDGNAARGRIRSQATRGQVVCEATVRFSVRQRP